MRSSRVRSRLVSPLLLVVWLACRVATAQGPAAAVPAESLKKQIGEQPSKQVMIQSEVAAAVQTPPVAQPSPEDAVGATPEPPGSLAVGETATPTETSGSSSGAGAETAAGAATTVATSVRARLVSLTPGLQRDARRQIERQMMATRPTGSALPVFAPLQQALIAPSSDGEELTLIPIALVDRPMSFAQDRGAYVGRIAVGLVALGYSGPAKTLKAPITFQILGADAATPDQQVVPSTSPPYPPMEISADDPKEAVDVRIFSSISADPIRLEVPVIRARLEIRAADRSLQGWGLERVGVDVVASNGARSAGQLVNLGKTDPGARGVIEPQEGQRLDSDGRAHFTLTSEASGNVALTATGPRLQASPPVTFVMDPPGRFLGAALLGGLIGGVLRRGVKGGDKPGRIALEFVLAVLAGALVFGMFVLGVNVTGFSLPPRGGEVLVAVVAAIGGLFGTKLLARA